MKQLRGTCCSEVKEISHRDNLGDDSRARFTLDWEVTKSCPRIGHCSEQGSTAAWHDQSAKMPTSSREPFFAPFIPAQRDRSSLTRLCESVCTVHYMLMLDLKELEMSRVDHL